MSNTSRTLRYILKKWRQHPRRCRRNWTKLQRKTHRPGHFTTPAPISSSFSSSPTSSQRCTPCSSSLISTTIRSWCRCRLIPFRDHLQPSHLRLPLLYRRWRLCPLLHGYQSLQPLVCALGSEVPSPMHRHGTQEPQKTLGLITCEATGQSVGVRRVPFSWAMNKRCTCLCVSSLAGRPCCNKWMRRGHAILLQKKTCYTSRFQV